MEQTEERASPQSWVDKRCSQEDRRAHEADRRSRPADAELEASKAPEDGRLSAPHPPYPHNYLPSNGLLCLIQVHNPFFTNSKKQTPPKTVT